MQIIDEHEDEYGLLQRGTIKRIVQQQKKVLPWLTENQIYSLRKRRHENKRHNALMAKEAEAFDSTNDDDDDDDSDSDFDFARLELDDNNSNSDSDSNASRVAVLIPFKTTVGRPKGTTEKQKELNRKKYEELTDDAAVTWYKIQKSSKRNNTRLFELIILKKDEHELPDAIIPETTIRSRLVRGNLSNVQRGRKSPMADVEPSLIMLLKYASRMGEYVSQRDCIKMANELISGSLVEKQLQEWKMNNVPYCKQRLAQDKSYIPKGEVGWGWFYAFHKRYSRPLNYNEKYGYDLGAPWIGEGEKLCDEGIVPTLEQLQTNLGPNRRFPGPINCKFNGKTIPSLVLASKGGGVNEDILVTALKHFDDLNVFPRGKGQPNPTLLLDGHGSRLQPKYVQYINNLKPDYSEDTTVNHRWNCALGLPNSTHHWQVGDSPEENQAFKYHSRVKKDSIRDLHILFRLNACSYE